MTPLREMAAVIRSKNAGPFELTLDILFEQAADYQRVKSSGYFSKRLLADIYGTTPDKVLNIIFFDPALAVKITMIRPCPSGVPGDTDVYGAQQHAPLLTLHIPD
jgi:hypothetical protein